MKYVLKTFCVIVLAALCFWFLAIPTQAVNRSLYDNANLITSNDEQYINNVVENIMKNQDYDLCIGTVTSLYSMTTREYAKSFAQTYGFSDNCIVFLIYQDTLYIYQFGTANLLTDNQIIALETKFAVEIVKSSAYYALRETLNDTQRCIQNTSGLNDVHNTDELPVEPSTWKKLLPDGVSLFVSCLLTILVAVVMVFYHNAANKKVKATAYLSHEQGFKVTDRTVIFVGTKQEIIRNYYKERDRR